MSKPIVDMNNQINAMHPTKCLANTFKNSARFFLSKKWELCRVNYSSATMQWLNVPIQVFRIAELITGLSSSLYLSYWWICFEFIPNIDDIEMLKYAHIEFMNFLWIPFHIDQYTEIIPSILFLDILYAKRVHVIISSITWSILRILLGTKF